MAKVNGMDLVVIAKRVRACILCALHQTRTNAVPGAGPLSAKIMLIGEAPGRNEDATGEPFCGVAGKILDSALEQAGLSRQDVFVTSVLKCRPPKNRNPLPGEVHACAKWLDAQLDAINPSLVVLLGTIAVQRFFPKTKVTQVRDLRGKFLERDGRTYYVAYHPAAVIYRRHLLPELKAQFRAVAQRVR